MAEIKKIKVGNTEYTITDANAIHGTTNSVSVAGTKKNVTSVSPNTLYVGNGLIMGGTAAAAGLVTRGICGVTTPDNSTGACTKESLYLNYDGDNNYSRKVVLGAGNAGDSIAGGATTFSAVRGDQMVNYVTSLGYTKNTGTVTSVAVKINGTVKGTITSSGTIDLGTYLTSHQSLANYVTLNTAQTITGAKTFNAPKAANGEQATATFKTANGGQIIFGKEGPNSGSMIALDQVAGTRRLNFRASATPGAIVWSQPESNSSLYYDVTNVYFRGCTHVSFNSASTITFNKFTNASALGTDANGNLKKVSLAKVATSGSYNDLSNKPTIPDISGKADKSSLAKVATSGLYNDLSGVPTLSTVAKTGSYSDLNNKPDVVTYSKSGSTHYLYAFSGGRYKITAPAVRKSDGTYEDVEILTTTNIATQGLFVPMTGTGTTPITSDLYMKGRYDRTISSSGLVPEGGGSVGSKPAYSEAYYGLKGICYSYYSDDSTYGATSNASSITNYQGFCYNPLEGSSQHYNQFQLYTPSGLSVYRWISQNGKGPNYNSMDWSSFHCSTIDSNGLLKYYDGSSTYTKTIKNLMEKMEISPIDGSGYATYGYVKDDATGLMICYGTTGSRNGAGVSVTFSATFKGAPTVVVVPYVKSLRETSIVSQYRNAITIRCYINSNSSNVDSPSGSTSITGFVLDTGNGEYQYFNYIAIGQYK